MFYIPWITYGRVCEIKYYTNYYTTNTTKAFRLTNSFVINNTSQAIKLHKTAILNAHIFNYQPVPLTNSLHTQKSLCRIELKINIPGS